MQCKNVCNLPETAAVNDGDGVLITQNGKAVKMLMSALRAYIGYASGADVLGVPTPTLADAGKIPAVNTTGDGYTLIEPATKDEVNAAASAASNAHTAANNAATAASNAHTAANNAASAASKAQTTANAALQKSGGTMTGQLKVKKLVLTSGVDYGSTLPAAGTAGRIFFKKV